MKKSFFYLSFIGLSILYALQLNAQQDPCKKFPPLPVMFIDSGFGNGCKAGFTKGWLLNPSKQKRLIKKNSVQKLYYFYTRDAINQLLHTEFEHDVPGYQGIRVYLARYIAAEAPTPFPTSSVINNEIVLLFAAVKDEYSEPVIYHFLDDNVNIQYDISNKIGQDWIDNYINNDLPELNKTIDINDPTSRTTPQDNASDTKSIYYAKSAVEEAMNTEYDYQKANHHVEISGVTVSFAAYDKNGRDDGKGKKIYKKRLLIIFSYMQNLNGKNVDFNLESQTDNNEYTCRRNKLKDEMKNKGLTYEYIELLITTGGSDLDNGKLCPYNCP